MEMRREAKQSLLYLKPVPDLNFSWHFCYQWLRNTTRVTLHAPVLSCTMLSPAGCRAALKSVAKAVRISDDWGTASRL